MWAQPCGKHTITCQNWAETGQYKPASGTLEHVYKLCQWRSNLHIFYIQREGGVMWALHTMMQHFHYSFPDSGGYCKHHKQWDSIFTGNFPIFHTASATTKLVHINNKCNKLTLTKSYSQQFVWKIHSLRCYSCLHSLCLRLYGHLLRSLNSFSTTKYPLNFE